MNAGCFACTCTLLTTDAGRVLINSFDSSVWMSKRNLKILKYNCICTVLDFEFIVGFGTMERLEKVRIPKTYKRISRFCYTLYEVSKESKSPTRIQMRLKRERERERYLFVFAATRVSSFRINLERYSVNNYEILAHGRLCTYD